MFTRAIVRPPAPNFAEGLTTSSLGTPHYERALKQHEAYCAALETCGLKLTRLEPDEQFPDSTFVEDTAVIAGKCAILTCPGAPSRAGEIVAMRGVLADFFPALSEIISPGTVDGGDVCEAGKHFFIGTSERTNEAGAQQLATTLTAQGYTSSFVDIRRWHAHPARETRAGRPCHADLLHLKSGLAYLGDNRLVVTETLAERAEFAGYDLIQVEADEEYAANCVSVNDYVLIAAGYPSLEANLSALGYQSIPLEMSEFQKMDGGLSCLSLRF
ncbi:MAG: N(G),N(G)-dimethylarginine dimethylaminohydrolase [Acidobacteriota bacterium]